MNIVASGKQNQMVALNLHAPNRLVASVARYAWTRPWMTRGPWFPCRWYIELSAIMTSNVPSRQLPISILSGVFPPMLDTHHVLTRKRGLFAHPTARSADEHASELRWMSKAQTLPRARILFSDCPLRNS